VVRIYNGKHGDWLWVYSRYEGKGNDSATSAASFRLWLGLGQATNLYHLIAIIVGNYRCGEEPLCIEEEFADGGVIVVECCCLERGCTGGVTLPAGDDRGLLSGREVLRRCRVFIGNLVRQVEHTGTG